MDTSPQHWYLATLVLEFNYGGPTSPLHVNSYLIRAASPEEALEKAQRLEGPDYEYTNLLGGKVKCVFRGINQLLVLPDQLEDGCELFWEEVPEATEEEIRKLIKRPEEMAAFSKPPRHQKEFPFLPIEDEDEET